MRLTRYGDADLSGSVNLADFDLLAANFGMSVAGPDVTPANRAALAVPEPVGALTVWSHRDDGE